MRLSKKKKLGINATCTYDLEWGKYKLDGYEYGIGIILANSNIDEGSLGVAIHKLARGRECSLFVKRECEPNNNRNSCTISVYGIESLPFEVCDGCEDVSYMKDSLPPSMLKGRDVIIFRSDCFGEPKVKECVMGYLSKYELCREYVEARVIKNNNAVEDDIMYRLFICNKKK